MSIGMSGVKEIRMSTRTLLDVLSGRISSSRLNEVYRYGNGKGLFEYLVRAGSMIENSRVEKKPNEDEDEIIFTFKGPDPAISAFTIPDEK